MIRGFAGRITDSQRGTGAERDCLDGHQPANDYGMFDYIVR
jgi:hypothetical protein